MTTFLANNWYWIALLGVMLFMHVGHMSHGGNGGCGGHGGGSADHTQHAEHAHEDPSAPKAELPPAATDNTGRGWRQAHH